MLDISLSLLLVTLVVFLLLIGVLNSWLFVPYLKFMEKRDADIQKDLGEANKNSDEINSLLNEAERILTSAKSDIAAMREKVISEAKKLAESKVEAKRNELETAYAEFEANLSTKRVELKNTLMAQVPLYKEALKAKVSQL